MTHLVKTLKTATLLSATLVLLASCAKISTVTTNVDRQNFKDYFAPSKVEIYESEQDFAGNYQFIGGVEGESCQQKPHHALPDPVEARTQARGKAFDLGANAIVFSGCTEVQTKQCHATTLCYGKAYVVQTIDE